MTTKRIVGHSRDFRSGGFTLVEIMIAMSLLLILGGIGMSSIFALTGGSTRLAEYVVMNNTSHRVLETFARDIRMANDVLQNTTADSLHLTRPNWATPDFDDVIVYRFDAATATLFRKENDGPEKPLLQNLDSFELRCYNILRQPTVHRLEVKEVQIDAVMKRHIASARVSNHIISARFMMRNKRVAE